MGRFITTTVYVEGRVRPALARGNVSAMSKLVVLLIAAPGLLLWVWILSTGLAVIPVLHGLVLWGACSVYAAYVCSDSWGGSRDRISVDSRSPGVRFRERLPIGRTLLLWAGVTGVVGGAVLGLVAQADRAALHEVGQSDRFEADTRWAVIGAVVCLMGLAAAGVWLILSRVPPGVELSPEGLAFRRGFAEERRAWGEVRSVRWSGGHGKFARLRVEFSEDRPLQRSSLSIASNVELVGRLIDFYRGHPQARKSLVALDEALETFEMQH